MGEMRWQVVGLVAAAGLVLGLLPASRAQSPVTQAVMGDWFTPDHQGVVRIAPCGGAICGTLVAMDYTGAMPVDYAGRSQCHYPLMRDFHPGDDGALAGSIINPDDGKVYQATLKPGANDTVKLRGYVFVPLFGSTQTWTRFPERIGADCHILPR